MDKLVKHGIRMLEIVEGENDFFRNDAKRQADIARAVYDVILRVQMLERKFDKDINVRSKEPQTVVRLKHFKCPKCGRSDYIRSFEDWGIDGGIYKYKCINCNTYIKDEPQTDCSWK